MDQINYFAKLNYRGRDDKFGIKTDDRRRHTYIIGKTGTGKTTLLYNMAAQDILNGNGLCVIDPHGEFAENILKFVPKDRINEVIFLNPADYERPIGLNLLEDVGYNQRHLVASGLMGVFKKIWIDVWSARMEYILNNTILSLLEYPEATLLDVNRMLANKPFRNEVLNYVKDPVVRAFWIDEFNKYSDRLASEATAAIQNKIGQFTTAPLIRNIVGQKDSTINLRKIMDEGKILVVNLSKGRIGEDNSRLLGAMFITKLYLAAMSRIDIPEKDRRDFYVYVDEFQNFASEAFEGILSESRKYHLSLILAHQYITQMDETVRDAVFGNIGTFIIFRIGADDAEFIENEFTPQYFIDDFVNLPNVKVILKLMIDGVSSRAFSAETLPPMEPEIEPHIEEIIESSRNTYGIDKKVIEDVIEAWNPTKEAPKQTVDINRFEPRPEQRKNFERKNFSYKKNTVQYPQNRNFVSLEEAQRRYPPKETRPEIHNKVQKSTPKPVDVKGLRDLLTSIEQDKENESS